MEKLTATLRRKAQVWHDIGIVHPGFADLELMRVLRAAADEIDRLSRPTQKHKRWAVISLDDHGCDPRAGFTRRLALRLTLPKVRD